MAATTDTLINNVAPANNGAPPADWRASLPEELRSEESIKNFKDVADLTKGFVETKKMVGNAIRIPKADAKPEEFDAFYARLGRPETPDKYEFTRPQVPENVKYDEEMETAFKGMAHKAGLSPRQAQALLEGYNEMQVKRLSGYTGQMEQGIAALKKEWGANYEKQIGLASRVVKEVGGEEMINLLNETGLGNHPTLVKFFAKLGAESADPGFIIGEDHHDAASQDAIKLKINEIMNDPKHPYNDSHAGYEVRQAALNQVGALYKQLYPPKQE